MIWLQRHQRALSDADLPRRVPPHFARGQCRSAPKRVGDTEIGLLGEERYNEFCAKRAHIEAEIERLNHLTVRADSENVVNFLAAKSASPLRQGIPASEFLKRPEVTYRDLLNLGLGDETLTRAEYEQVEIQIKYAGYIAKQLQQVSRMEKLENKVLSADLDYNDTAA